jgi:diguanylate cyclase (GGDEF)-like protein
MRYFEQVYLTKSTNSSLSSFSETIMQVSKSIENSSLQADQKEKALVVIDEYKGIAGKIAELETQIIENDYYLDSVEDFIEPSIIELRAAINGEVIRVESRINETRQVTTIVMGGGMVIGLVLAVLIARLLHFSITRNVLKLTKTASQLQAGDLDARVRIDSTDELGQLASTFNNMATQLGQTIDRMELIRRASLDWSRVHDVDKVIEIALDTAMCLSSADAGIIGLAEGEEIILAKMIGPHITTKINEPLGLGDGILARAVRHRQTVVMKGANLEQNDFNLIPENNSKIAIPLISAHQFIGVLYLEALQSDGFTTDIIEFLDICATGAAVAIHNALLYAEAQRLAIEDPLTGLYNRRGLFELSQLEINRIMRFQRPISALFIDIDHFKQFNDQYGYKIGDLVLRAVANCLRNNVRDIDLISRYGGEEFVILLPELDQREAIVVAERLRKTIEAECLETDEGVLSITISVGVASIAPKSDPVKLASDHELQLLNDLIESAGQMLHIAKEQGRNRVEAL